MAVEDPPGVLNVDSTDSAVQRHTTQGILGGAVGAFAGGVGAVNGGAHGVCGAGDLAVSQSSTPGMSVRVAAGLAIVTGTASALQGPYSFYNDAAIDVVTIAAADATNPRKDLVCAQVRDTTYDGSGQRDARIFVVTGTPAASPVDPSVPHSCLVLARVDVPALDTSITNAQITDLRTFAGRAAGPLGVIGSANRTTDGNGGITTVEDLNSLTVTFTASPQRRYRTTVHLPHITQDSTAGFWVLTINDGSNTVIRQSTIAAPASVQDSMALIAVESGLSGSITRKARMSASGGAGATVSGSSTLTGSIVVEDIGPA